MSASVTHFEIYAEDLTGLAQFYRDLFDWKIEKAPGVDYFRIQTGSDENHGIAGGMLNRPIRGHAVGFTTSWSTPSTRRSSGWRAWAANCAP